MWAVFILSGIAISFVALFLIWVGNKIIISIKKDNRRFEHEDEICNSNNNLNKKGE